MLEGRVSKIQLPPKTGLRCVTVNTITLKCSSCSSSVSILRPNCIILFFLAIRKNEFIISWKKKSSRAYCTHCRSVKNGRGSHVCSNVPREKHPRSKEIGLGSGDYHARGITTSASSERCSFRYRKYFCRRLHVQFSSEWFRMHAGSL